MAGQITHEKEYQLALAATGGHEQSAFGMKPPGASDYGAGGTEWFQGQPAAIASDYGAAGQPPPPQYDLVSAQPEPDSHHSQV